MNKKQDRYYRLGGAAAVASLLDVGAISNDAAVQELKTWEINTLSDLRMLTGSKGTYDDTLLSAYLLLGMQASCDFAGIEEKRSIA